MSGPPVPLRRGELGSSRVEQLCGLRLRGGETLAVKLRAFLSLGVAFGLQSDGQSRSILTVRGGRSNSRGVKSGDHGNPHLSSHRGSPGAIRPGLLLLSIGSGWSWNKPLRKKTRGCAISAQQGGHPIASGVRNDCTHRSTCLAVWGLTCRMTLIRGAIE